MYYALKPVSLSSKKPKTMTNMLVFDHMYKVRSIGLIPPDELCFYVSISLAKEELSAYSQTGR